MIGFWIFILIVTLLLPITMILLGNVFSNNKGPKEINWASGYRTTRSMKNQDTWQFAQSYMGKVWKIMGCVLTPVALVAMFFSFGKDVGYVGVYGMVIEGVELIVMLFSIVLVENALKRTFDDSGNRR